jgi:hypothetical protein
MFFSKPAIILSITSFPLYHLETPKHMKRKIILILFCLWISFLGYAQQFNSQANYIYTTSYTNSVSGIADINNDGSPDIMGVYTNASNDSIYVLPGAGNGAFQPPVLLARENNYINFYWADFNGDNITDLVISSYWNNGIHVYLGKGNYIFGPKTYYPLGAHGGTVTCSDVNKDGKEDILVLTSGSGTNIVLHIFMGKGDGTFAQKTSYPSHAITGREMKVVDLNTDGKPDIVIRSASSILLTYIQEHNGTFTPHYQNMGFYVTSLGIADVNYDQVPDLLTISGDYVENNKDTLIVRSGNREGEFPEVIAIQGSFKSMVRFKLADINQDGKIDLIGSSQDVLSEDLYADEMYYYKGKGNGTFEEFQTLKAPGNIRLFEIDDLNKDGFPDIVTFSTNNKIGVFLNKGKKSSNINSSESGTIHVYPNPFSDQIHFRFTTTFSSFAKLLVIDATGKQVATLLNEHVAPGTHKVSWKPGELASGMYLYMLTTDTDRKTGKIVLINNHIE